MTPEFPRIDQDKAVSPYAQEVECALILSQMINTVKEDPSQMRLAIYEFARARLQIDMSWADEEERRRLSAALETAIQGVEGFSARQDERERLRPATASAQVGFGASSTEQFTSIVPVHQINTAPKDARAPKRVDFWPGAPPILEVRRRLPVLTLARFWIGILIVGLVAGLAFYNQQTSLLRRGANLLSSMAVSKLAQPTSIPLPNSANPCGIIQAAPVSAAELLRCLCAE